MQIVYIEKKNNQHYDPGGVFSPQRSMLNPTVQPLMQFQGISNNEQIISNTNKVTHNGQSY